MTEKKKSAILKRLSIEGSSRFVGGLTLEFKRGLNVVVGDEAHLTGFFMLLERICGAPSMWSDIGDQLFGELPYTAKAIAETSQGNMELEVEERRGHFLFNRSPLTPILNFRRNSYFLKGWETLAREFLLYKNILDSDFEEREQFEQVKEWVAQLELSCTSEVAEHEASKPYVHQLGMNLLGNLEGTTPVFHTNTVDGLDKRSRMTVKSWLCERHPQFFLAVPQESKHRDFWGREAENVLFLKSTDFAQGVKDTFGRHFQLYLKDRSLMRKLLRSELTNARR